MRGQMAVAVRRVGTESIAFVAVEGGDPKGISTLATAIRDVLPR